MSSVTAIITCMTDGERAFLPEAIDSVLAQTTGNRVIVCVAESNHWVDDVLHRSTGSIELLRMPLAPIGTVRNAAVARVRTDLVAFLDGDDAWVPQKTDRQVRVLQREGLDVIGSKHVLVRDDGKPYFFAFAKDLPMPSSWLGRTSTFIEHPFTSIPVGEDVQLWDELVRNVTSGIVEAYLLRYRVRRGSLSQGTPSMRRKLKFERRSRYPGMRPALLGGSYAANLGLGLARRARPSGHTGTARLR